MISKNGGAATPRRGGAKSPAVKAARGVSTMPARRRPSAKTTLEMDSVEAAIAAIGRGEKVLVVDDEERENEGDLIMAAEKVTPADINFYTKYARGLICVPMTGKRLDELDLGPMVRDNTEKMSTAFTVSVDAVNGTTTGISAADRALTIRTLVDARTKPSDLERPGHIFPLRAREGGVLRRAGHTEAAVDLAVLAGLQPAGVLCEVMADDGSMMRTPELLQMARAYKLAIISIKALIEYRRRTERLIERLVTTKLPTKYGEFALHLYEEQSTGFHHVALVKGDVTTASPVLARVHSQCLTGDVFHSLRCDCGDQMGRALEHIEREGRGVLLYMRQEGRGIGLANKLRAYELQDRGFDTVEANQKLGFQADLRDYGVGAHILADLGLRQIRLLTNNPKKVVGLEAYGLEIVERVPLQVPSNPKNRGYLSTKRKKLGHLIDVDL